MLSLSIYTNFSLLGEGFHVHRSRQPSFVHYPFFSFHFYFRNIINTINKWNGNVLDYERIIVIEGWWKPIVPLAVLNSMFGTAWVCGIGYTWWARFWVRKLHTIFLATLPQITHAWASWQQKRQVLSKRIMFAEPHTNGNLLKFV